MTTRNWYLTKAAGLRVLAILALLSWAAVIALAVGESGAPDKEYSGPQAFNFLLTGG
jgi:hypothetical protein